MKLHLGCGGRFLEGWVNLDAVPRGDRKSEMVQADVCQELPFGDSTFEHVFSEDFLEHLPPEKRVHVINEIWRVLKPGGTMEHYVPNAGSRNDFGSPSHLSHWNLQCFEHFDHGSYRWAKDREYEGFIGAFDKVKAELVNFQVEEDHITRAQSIHVIYKAVK